MDNKYHKIINDKIHIIHINLDYLRKMEYNKIMNSDKKLMKDLYFLICGEQELNEVIEKSDNLMKDVIEEAKQIADINQMDFYLTEEEMIKADEEYYKAKYLEQGHLEEKENMILAFYQNGVSLDLISKSSGLSIEEIKKIINDNSLNE